MMNRTTPSNQSKTPFHKNLHTIIPYPNLGLDVFIQGNCFRQGAVAMFAKAGCKAAISASTADLVVFLGGEDINPKLYGEHPIKGTYFNEARDVEDRGVYDLCVREGIPMFGICRGMQLIHALNGSKLYQDVMNHTSSHRIVDVTDEANPLELTASSMHHQMCISDGKQIPVAYAKGCLSQVYRSAEKELSSNAVKELEAAYYPDIRAFCVQGHPEVGGYDLYTAWCLTKLADMMEEIQDNVYSASLQALPADPDGDGYGLDDRLPPSLSGVTE